MKANARSWLLVVAALAILSERCARESLRDRTLTLAVRADVTGFFPTATMENEAFTIEVNSHVYEGLVRFDRDLRPVPALAESWLNLDDRTWRFRLRHGVTFSDGQPVEARDVVASLRAILDLPLSTAAMLSPIESISAPDPRTVEIRTRAASPLLLAHLTAGFVVPASALRGSSAAAAIGTGPYTVRSWRPGVEIVLDRNERCLGRLPAYRRLRWLVVPDGEERVASVIGDRAQVADHVPLAKLDELRNAPHVRVVSRPGLRVMFLGLRLDRPPFSDPRVREALTLAVDRAELNRAALEGRGVVATQIVPAAVAGYDPTLQAEAVDRPRARRLLAEAGYADGLALRLDGTNDRYVNDVQILAELARQLHEAGIHADIRAMPKREFFPLLSSGESTLFVMGWNCDTLEAGEALTGLFRSPSPGVSNQNYLGLRDETLDRLVDESERPFDMGERLGLMKAALRRVHELRAVVPLVVEPESLILRSSVRWSLPLNLGLRGYEMEPAAEP